MPIKKSTATKKLKNTTNYSKAQIKRDLKVKLDRHRWFVSASKKAKDNITPGAKPMKPKKLNKSTKTTAQLRAIYAKKK